MGRKKGTVLGRERMQRCAEDIIISEGRKKAFGYYFPEWERTAAHATIARLNRQRIRAPQEELDLTGEGR